MNFETKIVKNKKYFKSFSSIFKNEKIKQYFDSKMKDSYLKDPNYV
jgi:hypothetical protein